MLALRAPARQVPAVTLCLDTQGEFALPAREHSVVARVSGLTFNEELVNGDLDVGVDKLGEVHKRSGM